MGISIKVKTNLLKNGKVYFGERDIPGEFETIYKLVNYSKSKETTSETLLVDIFNMFKGKGIAISEISIKDLTYAGTRMTELSKQEQLKPELVEQNDGHKDISKETPKL